MLKNARKKGPLEASGRPLGGEMGPGSPKMDFRPFFKVEVEAMLGLQKLL